MKSSVIKSGVLSLILLAGGLIAGAQTTVTVGPTGEYASPCAAFSHLVDGDTVLIDANGGVPYTDTTDCKISNNNLTITGVNGRPILDATNAGIAKGIWVENGHDVVIDNFEFRNAHNSNNAAGIRIEDGYIAGGYPPGGGNVTIERCYIHDNDDGILSGSADSGDQWYSANPYITMQYDEFSRAGAGNPGYDHNIYMGWGGNLTFTLQYSWSHDVQYSGIEVKSREPINNILYNLINDNLLYNPNSDPGGYQNGGFTMELPAGGTTYIVGNVIAKGPSCVNCNSADIMWRTQQADVTSSDPVYGVPNDDLHFINNTVYDDPSNGFPPQYVVMNCYNYPASTCSANDPSLGPNLVTPPVFENNIFIGPASSGSTPISITNMDSPAPVEQGNINLLNTPANLASLDFANPMALDFHLLSGSPAIGEGIYPPTNSNGVADPQALAINEYFDPANTTARPTPTGSTMDAGAFHYATVTPPSLNLTYTQTVTAPNTGTITVTGLPTPAAGQYNVAAFVSQNQFAIPNPLSVASSTGTVTTTFQAYSVAATTVVPVNVYVDGTILTANITINPGPTALQSITLDNTYFASTTVHLLGPGSSPVVVDLTSSDPSILYMPSTVTIPAGQLSAETGSLNGGLNPPAISQSAPVTLTATYNGNSVQLTTPIFSTGLHNVYCAPCTVTGGQTTGLGVILAGAGIYGGSTVQFTSDTPSVIANTSITIPAGQTSGNVSLPTNAVTTSTNVTVTANYNGQAWANTFTVTPGTGGGGTAASIAASSGSGQSAAVGTSFANPLVVLVEDVSSNPVSGVRVTFAGTGVSFPSGATAVTNSSGLAQVTAQPTSSGTLTITASVSGASTPATFTETGTGGGGNILTVGPTGEYATPCPAIRAASPGDTIEIDYNNGIPYKEPYDPNNDPNGDHRSDCVWYTNNLTIVGINGRAILDATGEVIEKAILNPRGANEVISNLELRNSTNGNNAAGIRIDSGSTNAPAGGNITVEDCYIHDNEDGVLTANVGPGSAGEGTVDPANDGAYLSPNPYITFLYDEFYHNGVNQSGSTHNMYIGVDTAGTTTFNLEYSWSHDALVGHTVKTRAPMNNILYNLITDEQGATSYLLDFPLGGSTYVVGNSLYKDATTNPSSNRGFMLWRDVADNSVGGPEYGLPREDLHFVNNTVVLDPSSNSPAYVVVSCQNSDASTCAAPGNGPVLSVNAVVQNNVFVGPTNEATNQTTAVASNNLVEANNAANLAALFVDWTHFNFHLVSGAPAIGAGIYPPTDNTGAADPKALAAYEYVMPTGAVARPTPTGGTMDEGAYSYPRADTPPTPNLSYTQSVTTPGTGTITLTGLPTPPSGQYNNAVFISENQALIGPISSASSTTGTLTTTFTAADASATTVVPIDIYVDGAYLTANVTVVPGAVALQSITLDSTYYPETTVHLTNASTSPVVVTLSTTDPSILAVPAMVTIPAGQLSAETGSETGSLWGQTPAYKTATISATYNGNTQTLPVNVYAPKVNHFFCNVYDPGCDVVGGQTVNFSVGIAGDFPASGGQVIFTSDTPSVIPNQTFTAPGGNLSEAGPGFNLTTNTVTTSTNVTISISVNGSTKTPLQVVTVTPAAGTNIAATSGSGQTAAVGVNFSSPLVVTVMNGSTPVSGATVTFTGTGVSFPSGTTAVTNSSGVAQVTAQPTSVGALTITANVSGASSPATFSETGTAGAPASIAAVSGSGQSANVGSNFANPLVVVVKDANSNPVSGATVTFAGTNVSFPSGATAVTNSSGDAQVTAQPTASGALTITASVSGVSAPASFSETGISAVAISSITLDSPYGATTTVNLTAAAPTGGVVVQLSSSDSSILYVPATVTVPAGATSAETGSLLGSLWGQSPSSKTATITAIAGGVTKTLTAAIPTPSLHDFGQCGACTVVGGNPIGTVLETAFGGAPVGGATVTLTSNNTAVIPNQTYNLTAGQGYLGMSINTNAVSTTTTVTVTVDFNGATWGLPIQVTAGPNAPATIAAVSGSGQSATVGTSFTNPLVVLVENSSGGAVSGATVTFTGSGVSFPSGATAVTNSSGQALVTVQPTNVGALTVTASVTGVSTPATFSETGISPVALSSITLDSVYQSGTTVHLTAAAPTGGVVVQLSTSDPTIEYVPATVTVPAGQTSAETGSLLGSLWGQTPTSKPATVTASYGGVQKTLAINVPYTTIHSFGAPTSVVGGQVAGCWLETAFNTAPFGGASFTISSDTPAVIPTQSFTLAAGQSNDFSIALQTNAVSTATTVNVTVNYNGATWGAAIVVNP